MQFRKDPCGVICLLITYGAVFYADFVVVNWICLTSFYESFWGILHIVLFNIVVSFLTCAHLRAVVSDPGMVPIPSMRHDFSDYHDGRKERDEDDWTVCARCEIFRPPRAHHCRICKRCVRRMDHHCPWINNCVGECNQKYFMQFLFYVGLLCAYAAGLCVYAWITDCPNCPDNLISKQTRVLHSVILMLECLIFGMFVLAIMIDQLSAIFSDETAVEHVKKLGRHRPKKPKLKLLGEICGRGPIFLWFLPCHSGPKVTPADNEARVAGGDSVSNYDV